MKLLDRILHPTKILIALIIVSTVWIFPVFKTENKTLPNQSLTVYAGEHTGLSCSYGCQIDVCTKWVPPSATCQPDNPWDIGCCVRWERQCGPDCEDEPPANQPPTISHILSCSQTGNTDWCIGTLSLDLTASDPQNAQVVISGVVNGIAFSCPIGNTTCSIPLSDGQGTITYRVDSATGLSDSDTTTYKLDSTTPQINGSVIGANGLNPSIGSGQGDWYTSSTTLSAIATDTTSGISTFEMNINNTGWVNYAETTFTDGINTIQYRAIDNAGNVTETAVQEIKVDTVTPVINISITGPSVLNNWYTSNVILSAATNDITSGINSFEINLNNAGWTTFDLQPVTLTDGIHSIQYRATDNAGNTYTTASQEIKIDTVTPSLSLSTTGTKGINPSSNSFTGWYVSIASITPTTNDTGSGIMSIEYSLNNGAFTAYTSPLQFNDGINTYQIKITDYAGNTTITPTQTIKVDTIAPMLEADSNINLGQTLYYTLEDNGSGLWIERIVIEDEDEKYKKRVWLQTISGNKVKGDILWDGIFADRTTAPAGEYYITLKISDQAGNETIHTTAVTVSALSYLLPITPFTPPTSEEVASNELPSDEDEQTFGNENNGNVSNETTSNSTGGETVFANSSAQAGIITNNSFTSGNENTTTPITNSNILWGAIAAAAVGATVADWQRRREEEEARQRELARIAQMEKNAERKAEKARLDYLNAAYQAKLDREKEKQIAVSAARWNGIAHIEKAKEKAKQVAVSAARWAGIAQIEKDKEKVNAGGSKPLMKPIPPNPKPPSPWEKLWDNTKSLVINAIDDNFPALRATGPGENGISIVNKIDNKTIITAVVSSFNNLIRVSGGIPYQYEKKPGKFEERNHSVPIHPTSIAISLSVQSEAPPIIDTLQWLLSPLGKIFSIGGLNSPSYGLAQINPDKYSQIKDTIKLYTNFDGVPNNPFFALYTPQVSTAAMIERVTPAVEVCEEFGCTPTDREIVIALTQNGNGFSAENLEDILKSNNYQSDNSTTIINWQDVFNERTIKDDGLYNDFLNWRASDHNFDTWFMLNRYYDNAMAFEASGDWSMPQGVDWEYINSLIENTPPSGQ